MTDERKPYVRYSISAKITDKGIAYAAKRAVNTFLDSHGFEGRVTELEASSDTFQAVLELFDNGKYDFNIRALSDHLEVSGRLPTKESIRPKITIKPISGESGINVVQQAPETIAYQKTLERVQKQVEEKDDEVKQREVTIRSLNDILRERQTAIDESTRRIVALEQRLGDATPKQYASAIDAIRDGYLKNALEIYMDISVDLKDLSESNNLKLFQDRGSSGIFFAKYLNAVYHTEFQSDTEVEKWREKMCRAHSWRDIDEVKKLEDTKNHYAADQEIMQLAEQKGVSPEILELLKRKVNESETLIGKLETEVKHIQGRFEKDKKVFDCLTEAQNKYRKFARVTENSINRRKMGAQLPIVMEIFETKPGMALYLPYDDSKCELEKQLHYILTETTFMLSPPGINVIRHVKDNSSYLMVTLKPELIGKGITQVTEKVSSAIRESQILKALGLTVKVTQISETQTKPV